MFEINSLEKGTLDVATPKLPVTQAGKEQKKLITSQFWILVAACKTAIGCFPNTIVSFFVYVQFPAWKLLILLS